MKVFILLSVVAVALASRKCGVNEHFEACGSACPLTCDNCDNPPRACILRCDIGCHCDEGYVRNSEGQCVRPEACPAKAQQCGVNEHFESCGSACPLTCDNYDKPPRACILRCDIGCHCDEGYVRNSEGQCVRPEACPAKAQQVCGENERYLECGTACPLTCENYSNPPKFCPAMCVMGCHCEQGYVKTSDGRCVRPENCPIYARPTEKTCVGNPDPGMCLAYIPSWYYDIQTEKCHKFIYGGCQGNGNRYDSEKECLEHCGDVKLKESKSEGICDLPAETGVCRGFFPRYFFDRTTGQCERFVYGGCGGNENNFESEAECSNNCAARAAPTACQEEKVVGPCKAAFRRFYFNKDSGKCEEFTYGGCGGNSNNFNNLQDCHAVCVE